MKLIHYVKQNNHFSVVVLLTWIDKGCTSKHCAGRLETRFFFLAAYSLNVPKKIVNIHPLFIFVVKLDCKCQMLIVLKDFIPKSHPCKVYMTNEMPVLVTSKLLMLPKLHC